MRGIVKAPRRPPGRPCRFARATGGGGVPRLLDGVPRGSRCPASPRHVLLAENLWKPSLGVITKDLWYYDRALLILPVIARRRWIRLMTTSRANNSPAVISRGPSSGGAPTRNGKSRT